MGVFKLWYFVWFLKTFLLPVEFTFDYKVQRPLLFGGPFKSPYIFEMIHFHWGPLKDSGSEHFINSKSYHMEMHVTHRHPRYRDMTEAAKYKNGIVVLAFLFEVGHLILLLQWLLISDSECQTVISGLSQGNGFPAVQQRATVENGQLQRVIPGLSQWLHAVWVCRRFGWGVNSLSGLAFNSSLFACVLDCG